MSIISLRIDGMTCAGCTAKVKQALASVGGTALVSVDFATGKATVTLAPGQTAATESLEHLLVAAARRAGYRARVVPPGSTESEAASWRREAVRMIGTGVLLLGGWLLGVTRLADPRLATGLVIMAIVLAAYPVFRRAMSALLVRTLDADVLVAIAVVAAASVGEFVAAGEVAFIMLVGAYLENYTVRRARRSLGGLMSLVPARARVRRGEQELDVATGELQVGDLVVVRAGERVPVDGVVRAGTASVNQAPVTGESVPVEKGVGGEVFVGTLAESGALVIEATRVGDDTTLARIGQLVEAAQRHEAPIQRTLDRFARWLVPVMLGLAALVFVFTRDLSRAITVLIVACPCALVLATPTAVMAAIARAARAGVLIKGGEYLEATARLHTIVFDKTGTLTYGQLEVTDVRRFCDHSEAELVEMAAVAEKLSGHPVARAILRRAEALGIAAADPTRFQSQHGRGVTAEHNGQQLAVGHQGFMAQQAVPVSADLQSHVDERHDAGQTTVMVAHDGQVCGTICLADTVRTRAADAVRALRDLGIERVVMLTGDNQRVAMQIGDRLGIDEIKAGVLPGQKARHIELLKQTAARSGGVAMVGDGINDAPALAMADVGIALRVGGTDVANEAADIALMADDLSKIAFTVGLSRAALRVIQQGLWFALAYNTLMVGTAAVGCLGMIGGAVAHQISSVLVILNAMRLLRYRAEPAAPAR